MTELEQLNAVKSHLKKQLRDVDDKLSRLEPRECVIEIKFNESRMKTAGSLLDTILETLDGDEDFKVILTRETFRKSCVWESIPFENMGD